MFLRKILTNWRGSFSLFSKKELLVFVFSWIKTFKRSFFVLIKYFSLLFLLNITFPYLFLRNQFAYTNHFVQFGSTVLYMLLIFFAILSVRSSVSKKTLGYYLVSLKKFPGFAILFLCFRGIKYIADTFLFRLIHDGFVSEIGAGVYQHVVFFLKIPVVALIYFFFIDSSGSPKDIIKSCANGIRFVVNFLPIALIFFLLPVFLWKGLIGLLMGVFSFSTEMLVAFGIGVVSYVVDFVVLCGVFAYYLKIKHGNYTLFFK